MVDALYQLGETGPETNFPAIKTTLNNGVMVMTPIWLVAGLRTYVAAVVNSAVGASKNHLLLFNQTGSGKTVRVWDIRANPNITGTVTGTSIVLNIARCSNEGTGGSTTNVLRQTDTRDDPLPSQIVGRTAPTSVTISSFELASATVLVEETSGTEGRLTLFKADSVIAPLVINENQGIVIQQGTFVGVGALNIFMYFTMD